MQLGVALMMSGPLRGAGERPATFCNRLDLDHRFRLDSTGISAGGRVERRGQGNSEVLQFFTRRESFWRSEVIPSPRFRGYAFGDIILVLLVLYLTTVFPSPSDN
jgi:hypothetical protein